MYLAIDIGGTKTLIASFSSAGKKLQTIKFETPKNYNDFIQKLQENFEQFFRDTTYNVCAVGCPGLLDIKKGTVITYTNLDWQHVPLADDIAKITKTKTYIENDANLAGLSEATLISKSYSKVFYITVSTGIGGVIILNGQIDPNYRDMEPGHMQIEVDGRIREWEDIASGSYITKEYGVRASDLDDNAAWHKITHRLALGLINVCANVTPEVIVIGGGVGTHFDKFGDMLHEKMMTLCPPEIRVPALKQAIRAEEAVIYGCYELARQHA